MNHRVLHIPHPPDLHRLELPSLDYQPEEPAVIRLRSAFVSARGLVLKGGRLHPRCAPHLVGQWDTTFRHQWWKLAMEEWAVSRFGKSLKMERHEGPLGLVHSPWMNYYFWLCHSLPRLELLLAADTPFTLLLPAHYAALGYVQESLQAYPEVAVHYLPEGSHAQVKNLLLAPSPRWSAEVFPAALVRVRQRLLKLAGEKAAAVEPKPRLIYRGEHGPRAWANSEAVLATATQHGLLSWQPETEPFWSQVTRMAHCPLLVGTHGAGLANMLLLPTGSTVVELMPQAAAYRPRVTYIRLAAALGLNYRAVLCPVVGQAHATDPLQSGAIEVPTDALTDVLENLNHG